MDIQKMDDGYIINNLHSSGFTLSASTKRRRMLEHIVRNYSLRFDEINNVITTTATAETFPSKKHLMVQAMLSIDDMFEVGVL